MLDKEIINSEKIPNHIAIIMDGNGRWAKSKGYIRSLGHENGVDALRKIATASAEIGVKFLTVYAFSTENWNRPKLEVRALMNILVSALHKELKTLMDNNIRLHAIGNLQQLPEKTQKELQEVINITKDNKHMVLTLALSYSAKEEILQATKAISEKVKSGLLDSKDIDFQCFESHLYTHNMPNPDLLIRTSGEYRISNYLLWQIAYAELYFSEKLWPDFDRADLEEAILVYQKRERRYGLISEQINHTL